MDRFPGWPVWTILAVLAGCAGPHGGETPALPAPAGPVLRGLASPLSGIPGIVEIPGVPAIPAQIASDGAGNEWIAGFGPATLVRINEHTRAVSQFNLPNHNSDPFAVALGRHGTGIWFTELASNTIGYIHLSNFTIHRYTIPTAHAQPYGITAGPDNAMWFTEFGRAKIGRIDLSTFKISEDALPANSEPYQIVKGPDGALWFTDYGGKGIGRMTASHHFSPYPFKSVLFLDGITAATDGGIWFTGSSSTFAELVGRIDPSTHARKVWFYDKGGSRTPRFVVNRSSDLWFTEQGDAVVARFDINAHTLHRYALPSGYAIPLGIALGSDDQIWLTEQDYSPTDPAAAKLCPTLSKSQCE